MNKKSMLYKTLHKALHMKRPHNSVGTHEFTDWLVSAVPERLWELVFLDDCGNIHVDARLDVSHRTLFVAHVDTVHKGTGSNNVKKFKAKWMADGSQLGADDGAGCAILMHLLEHEVPGYYIFTQGEECGGIGATFVATEFSEFLHGFDRAIAFDRRGIDSVITHQGWGRCCSDEFGEALSNALNMNEEFMYSPDSTGVYTDTAEFVDYIPECTNISVGYYNEHSDKEYLDIIHFNMLANTVINIDWDSLPTTRDPKVKDDMYNDSVYYGDWNSVAGSGMYYDYAMMDLKDAIMDAMVGMPDFLIEMMAESVYPDDVNLAKNFINDRALTKDVLDNAMRMTNVYDPDTVLATVFDMVYKE